MDKANFSEEFKPDVVHQIALPATEHKQTP